MCNVRLVVSVINPCREHFDFDVSTVKEYHTNRRRMHIPVMYRYVVFAEEGITTQV